MRETMKCNIPYTPVAGGTQAFLRVTHNEYGAALAHGDLKAMCEISSRLSLAYIALGDQALAEKWTEEYRHNMSRAIAILSRKPEADEDK